MSNNPSNLSPAQLKRMQEKEAALAAKKQKQLIVLIVFALVVVWFQFFRGGAEEAPPPPPAAIVALGADGQVVTDPNAPAKDATQKDPALLNTAEKRKLQAPPDRWPGLQNVPATAKNPYPLQDAVGSDVNAPGG